VADERLFWNQLALTQLGQQVIAQAVFVIPLRVVLLVGLIGEADLEAWTQHRLGAQYVLEPRHVKLRGVEEFFVRPEAHAAAGALGGTNALQFRGLLAVGEGHLVFLTAAPDKHFEFLGQRVHHRHAHAVQAAGIGVVLVRELAAGVQAREDHLDARHALALVLVHRHAAAVVADRERTVLIEHHVNAPGVAGDGLVHGVVDDFLRQMIRPGGVGVHPRALTHRFEPGQDFNGRGIVSGTHAGTVALTERLHWTNGRAVR